MAERRADDASRDVDGFLKAEFMSERLGEEFDAVVTGVTGFGVFVQLEDFFIDGLVHISDLGGDYFHFEAARWRLVGEKSGQVFRLGSRIRVKVASADLEEGRVDFVPARKSRGGKGRGNKPRGKPAARANAKKDKRKKSGAKKSGRKKDEPRKDRGKKKKRARKKGGSGRK